MSVDIEDSYVSPRYGFKQPAPAVRFSLDAADAVFLTVLYPYRASAPRFSVEALAAALPGGIRITLERLERLTDELTFPDDAGVCFERRAGGGPAILRYLA